MKILGKTKIMHHDGITLMPAKMFLGDDGLIHCEYTHQKMHYAVSMPQQRALEQGLIKEIIK